MSSPATPEQLKKMHAYWCAANYLTVGQIYLKDNPLLDRPLSIDDIKPRLLGHWGTTTGLNFIYTHLNRLINENDLNMIYVIGPGHGRPGRVGVLRAGERRVRLHRHGHRRLRRGQLLHREIADRRHPVRQRGLRRSRLRSGKGVLPGSRRIRSDPPL